ncbi:unnamed protein product [Ectocarpus sp. 12 AP-2014]
MQDGQGDGMNTAWFNEMISKGFVTQRHLPQHAGGPPAAGHAGSPIESILNPDEANENRSPGGDQAPAPAQQPQPHQVQETGASRSWLQGPLRDCARNAGDDGALARSLLDAGAPTNFFDRTGRSPLHWACTRGNTAVVLALLEAGADGFARDGSGKTPLHCAAQVGHTTVVMVLLEFYGFAPIGLPPRNVPTSLVAPALEAEELSWPMAAAMPQQNGVESIVDARNVYGSTALHRAAFNGREGVVLALLRGGADVCVVGNSGRRVQACSALHLACQNAHAGCVQLLLAWGAQESAIAKDGSTPWSQLALAAETRPRGCPRVAKTALLLNTARGARTWARRGWLLMLRDKHSRGMFEAEDIDLDGRGGACSYMEDGQREDLARLVNQLVGIGEEGCFRLVVGFL